MEDAHVQASVLSSGSGGNAVYVEADGTGILVDCGLTVPGLKRRLSRLKRGLQSVRAVFVTHDHGDHVGSSVALSRKMEIPLYATAGTHSILRRIPRGLAHVVRDDHPIPFGPFEVFPVTTPHDGIESVAFRIVHTSSGRSISIVTDLGYVTRRIVNRLRGTNTLVVEHNHDERMLIEGPYPAPLKRRILSAQGHLSNEQGADLVLQLSHSGLSRVVLAHLSETNNTPELARRAYERANGASRKDREVLVAEQSAPTPLFPV
jgi:phosphoribosyl 1,2-cyclic phosphodiesterase